MADSSRARAARAMSLVRMDPPRNKRNKFTPDPSGRGLRGLEEARHDGQIVRHRSRRQGGEKTLAVAHAREPRVQYGEHAAIRARADQPAQPLQQGERRQGNLVLVEWLTAASLNGRDSCFD